MKTKNYKPSILCQLALLSTSAITSFFANANEEEIKNEIAELSREITALKNKITLTEPNIKPDKKGDIKFYATLRPTFGYIDESGEETWDIRDALSHAGFKVTHKIMEGLTATAHGEWNIALAKNADFGGARQVYVALDSAVGRVGLGKQRPTQYTMIAEYVDIFNHASSPFAYDPESVFFVDNLVSYRKALGNFTYMATAQFNGSEGANANDLVNTGISYDNNNLHLAVTYLDQKIEDAEDVSRNDEVWAGAIAYTFANGLYTAVAYQDRTYTELTGSERDGSTLDLALAYPLGKNYKLKTGYFEFEDGLENNDSGNYNGYNLTLEWQPLPALRLHMEYLNRDFDFNEEFSSLSVGFRYDFSILTGL